MRIGWEVWVEGIWPQASMGYNSGRFFWESKFHRVRRHVEGGAAQLVYRLREREFGLRKCSM